jgi:TolA-binding protein
MESEQPKPRGDSLAEQVADLSRQITETRNQIIKTANILSNLSGEVRAIGQLHQQNRRSLAYNSAAAYVLFLIVISTSFYFTYRARVERLDFEKDTVVREHAATRSQLEKLNQAVEKRRETETKAAVFYRLSKTGQVEKALKQYPDVAQLPLSRVEAAVFQDWVTASRSRLAFIAYTKAMKAVGDSDWKTATVEFRHSVHYLSDPPHEAALRYYWGISLMKMGDYQEAVEELEKALAADGEKLVSTDIRYQLGTIYEQVGRRDKARSAYEAFLKRNPQSPLARLAQRRLSSIK